MLGLIFLVFFGTPFKLYLFHTLYDIKGDAGKQYRNTYKIMAFKIER
jgi:hypothetical protein